MKKNKIIKKAEGMLIAIILISTLLLSLVAPAADYETQNPDPVIYLTAESSNVTIGDQINLTMNLSSVDNIDTWWLKNMTYNWDKLWIVNLTPDPDTLDNATVGTFWTNPADGARNNLSGWITDPQGFTAGGTATDAYLCAMNFSADAVGIAYFNMTDLELHFEGPEIPSNTSNCTVTIHPAGPGGLTATKFNWTEINITVMTLGEGSDTNVLCGKVGSYPTDWEDSLQYNGTDAFFNDTGLTDCTTYYYRLWGYNITSNLYSLDNQSAFATTDCITNFTFTGITPANASTQTNCTYDIAVNLTITNSQGRSFSYWINASNGQTTSGAGQAANTSIGLTLTTLLHNTVYWWNVATVETGLGNEWKGAYYFTTGNGGGTAPTAATPNPTTGAATQPILLATMSVIVTDVDGDIINTTFYWANGTLIGNNLTNVNTTTATITPALSLGYNTTYTWYVITNDSCVEAQSASWTFTTAAVAIDATKEWSMFANNTIQCWVNITNVGSVNLTNVVINETLNASVVVEYVNIAFDAGTTNWTIAFLNITGDSRWWNVTIYLNLSGNTITNNSSIQNTVTALFTNDTYDTGTFANPPTLCFYVTKEANMTTLEWNTTHVNFTINITNCGDFYLNWVTINESYGVNFTYNSSTITGNSTNTSFNITQIVPGAVGNMTIRLNTSYNWGVELVNGSLTCNNITVSANETHSEVTFSECLFTGARTTMVRISYTSIYYDITTLTNTIFTILGILLVIGAVMFIVYIIQRRNW